MSSTGERTMIEEQHGSPTSPPGSTQSGKNAPLVIVSQRGKHSSESRKIVRAQAARASAAQSRVTRARNREGRETIIRERPQSPRSSESTPIIDSPIEETAFSPAGEVVRKPLVRWLMSARDMSANGLIERAQSFASPGAAVTGSLSAARGPERPRLPLAVPRGFANLQQRITISDDLISLVSRTSCFDFGSPGVEERLHQLLLDITLTHARSVLLSPLPSPGHAIQGHLRVACTCLTIFQGQRANGAVANDEKYQTGLEAAWSEATHLDPKALTEPKSAEASLWAIFIISVTTGAASSSTTPSSSFFHHLLHGLFQDLHIHAWAQVRGILLDFIYPVSYLDEPCRSFFERLQHLRIGVT